MTGLTDTNPEAEAVQVALLRSATVRDRVNMVRRMTHTALAVSRRAIQSANPELTPAELKALFVELNYGRELADGVRQRLMS